MSQRGGGWDEDPEYDFDPDVEDYERYDDEDGEPSDRRRPLMLLTVIALLAVFSGVVFLAYQQGTHQGADGAPPLLRADGEPTKELPANPGGKKFPHQDAGVYNRITGSEPKSQSADGEQLLPPAEEPLEIDKPSVSQRDQMALDRLAQSIETAPMDPVGEAPPTAQDEAPARAEQPSAPAEPAAAPVQTSGQSGSHVVQLAAFRDEAAARDAFAGLQKKYPSLLGGMSADIQRADLAEKGIYYRLRAGYLDKPGADALCGQLEAQGQGCLVRPR